MNKPTVLINDFGQIRRVPVKALLAYLREVATGNSTAEAPQGKVVGLVSVTLTDITAADAEAYIATIGTDE